MKLKPTTLTLILCLVVYAASSVAAVGVSKDTISRLLEAGEDSEAERMINVYMGEWFESFEDESMIEDGYFIGGVLRKLHRVESAVTVYERMARVVRELGDTINIAETSFQLGRLYSDQGIERHAMEELFSALTLFQSLGNESRSARTLNQLGIVKKRQGFYQESIDYFTSALELLPDEEEVHLRSAILNNLGSGYKKLKNYPRAKEFFLRAIELNKEIGKKRWLSYNYNNLANIYEETGDLSNALIYHRMGVQLKFEVRDYPGLASSYANLSLVFEKKGELDSALYYIEKADELAMLYKVADIIPEALSQHANLLNTLKQFDRAYLKMKQLHDYKDSLATVDKSALISKMESTIEREQMETENALLKKDLELQQAIVRQKDLTITGFIVGLLMLAILVFLVVKATIDRSRTNHALEEQNASIQQQNDQIRLQKTAIEETSEKMKELQKEKEVFYSTITHDMRGPLYGILATTQMLHYEHTEGEVADQIMALDFSAQALLQLIDDLLDYHRHEANRFEINPKAFDLKELIMGTINTYRFTATEKDLTFTHQIDVSPSLFLGDKKRIGQVLFNLLGNAFKFTSKGYVKMNATALPTVEGNSAAIIITIEDSGIGMSEEAMGLVFKRFEQAPELGTINQLGSGLGLYICKMITEAMGGSIDLVSEIGSGSTFTLRFELPIIRPSM